MFPTKVSEKLKTYILCLVRLFFENRAVYGIIWKNIVEPDRPQMTVWRLCIAYWITKVAYIQSGYVILVSYCYNGCTKAPQCYVIRTLPFLLHSRYAFHLQEWFNLSRERKSPPLAIWLVGWLLPHQLTR